MDSGAVQNNAQGSGEVRTLVLFDVVHDVVKDLAPEELSLLAGLSRFDEAEAGRRLARGAKRDDPLGFGMGEVVAMVTPVVWIAVREAAKRAAASAADGLSTRVRVFLRKKLGRKAPAAPLPHFGPEELAVVRSRVLELAVQGGMKQMRAEQLADCVVGRLALGSADDKA